MTICVFICPSCGATSTGACSEMVCNVCGYVAEFEESKPKPKAANAQPA